MRVRMIATKVQQPGGGGGIKTQVTDLSYDHDGQIGLKPNGAEGAYLGVAEPKGLSQLHLDILSP